MNVHVASLQQFLNALDPIELQCRIRDFRNLQHELLSYQDLGAEILKVLSVPSHGGNPTQAMFLANTGTYELGTRFYRVRLAEIGDTKFPLKCLSVESDVWARPAKGSSKGRINKEEESVLYTSPHNPMVALAETRAKSDQLCCIIVYEAVRPIQVSWLGSEVESFPGFGHLSPDAKLKLMMLHDFLVCEFTREVGGGCEHLYRISEIIAKDYFDLPEQHGWCYPSVVKRPSLNVAFPNLVSRDVLKLKCVWLGSPDYQRGGVNVKVICEWHSDEKSFSYNSLGSEAHLRLAPEIQPN